MMAALGDAAWFSLGDRDLADASHRTAALARRRTRCRRSRARSPAASASATRCCR